MIEKVFYISSSNPDSTLVEMHLDPAIYIDKSKQRVMLACMSVSFDNFVYDANDNDYLFPIVYVQCSLANDTSSLNGRPSNIIDSIAIDASEIVKHVAVNPIPVDCSGIIGNVTDNIKFWLSDPANNVIEFPGRCIWHAKMVLTIE